MEIKNKIRITLAQVDIVWENPARNLDHFAELIEGQTEPGDIIVLPETFTTGFSMRAQELAETMNGTSVLWMKQMAQKTKSAVCGSLIIKENDQIFNRFVFATPEGELYHYDKRHLFSIGGENKAFNPGFERKIINYLGWRIGLYICYDLRFPVWCRNRNDTDLMIFTSNWPAPRNFAWNSLLKARAIENQVYVAGVNRVGVDGNRIKYTGESQAINPYGESVISPMPPGEKVVQCEFVLSELQNFRKRFPVSEDADNFKIL